MLPNTLIKIRIEFRAYYTLNEEYYIVTSPSPLHKDGDLR